MGRKHVVMCGAALMAGMAMLAVGRGTAALGALPLLVCPAMMVVMMWMMFRHGRHRDHSASRPTEQPGSQLDGAHGRTDRAFNDIV